MTNRDKAHLYFKCTNFDVMIWEQLGIPWVLHHKNPEWKTNDVERYNQWNIDDLVPMVKSVHTSYHCKGKPSKLCGKNHPMYGVHRFGKDNPNYGNHKLAGENNPMYGKHHTEETLNKISASNTGKRRTQEIKNKLSKSHMKKVICIETCEVFDSVKLASVFACVSPGRISDALHGKQETAGGYHWEYYREEVDNK